MTDVAPPSPQWHAPHNPWLITVVATLATFMEILDTTIVNVALPNIAGNLGADVADSTWILTSYLVSNAIVLPLSAWLSSLLGRKNFYMACVALFTFSSFLCGMAPTLETLVIFRLLQGLAGGGLQPTSQAILVDTFPPQKRGMGMAAYGMTVVVAPIIGPTLGGWITDNYNWRWIFFINIPVGLIALWLSRELISDPPYLMRRLGPGRFKGDFIGLGLVCLGIGALQMMLDLGDRKGWMDSNFIVTLAGVAGVALTAAVFWELRHKDPIMHLRLLGERNLGVSALIMFIFGMGLYASGVLLSLFMQTLMHYTALQSGMAFSPGGLVTMAMLPFVGMLLARIDARYMILSGIVIVSYSLLVMGRFSLDADFHSVMMARIVQGAGFAFIFVPVNTVAYAYVAPKERNDASSLISVMRNIGGSIGIAVSSTMVGRLAQVHQNTLVGHLTPYDPGYAETLQRTTQSMFQNSGDPVGALEQAQGALYGFMRMQAGTLAFVDMFRYLALSLLVLIPFILLMRRPPHQIAPGRGK